MVLAIGFWVGRRHSPCFPEAEAELEIKREAVVCEGRGKGPRSTGSSGKSRSPLARAHAGLD